MLKIGVVGVGHFGRFHIQAIRNIEGFELVGFYDIDAKRSHEVSSEFNLHAFSSYQDLLDNVDVVDIVVPTVSHYDCAVTAIKQQKHIFLEKPVTDKVKDAELLLKLATEAQVKAQVGHIERFNPAFLAAKSYISNPMFIEIHRLAQFTIRSTDVSVIFNLMIHDIDIVLSVVKSNIKKIHASGMNVVTDATDIANARIEFDNGCVANITSSRISTGNMRRMRFFQKDTYINVDCFNKKAEVIQLDINNANPFSITDLGGFNSNAIPVNTNNAIQVELTHFLNSIENNTEPIVSLYDGVKALQVAQMITDKISSIF